MARGATVDYELFSSGKEDDSHIMINFSCYSFNGKGIHSDTLTMIIVPATKTSWTRSNSSVKEGNRLAKRWMRGLRSNANGR